MYCSSKVNSIVHGKVLRTRMQRSLFAGKVPVRVKFRFSAFKWKKYDPARTRTWNPLIRSQMPYPLGHRAVVGSVLSLRVTHSLENDENGTLSRV